LQFAIAGMNAHINRDLPYAIVTNCRNRGVQIDEGLPFHVDYLFVNQILDDSEQTALHDSSVGLVSDLPFGLLALMDVLAMWSVHKARDAAWVNAKVLWNLPAPLGELHMDTVDAYVGGFSRGLLAHLPITEPSARDDAPVSSTHRSRRASVDA